MSQLALDVTCCKWRGCTKEVAGSSITGEGHVCRAHNVQEWARVLNHPSQPRWIRGIGADLARDIDRKERR